MRTCVPKCVCLTRRKGCQSSILKIPKRKNIFSLVLNHHNSLKSKTKMKHYCVKYIETFNAAPGGFLLLGHVSHTIAFLYGLWFFLKLRIRFNEKKDLQKFGFKLRHAIGLSHVKMIVTMFVQYMNRIILCANVSTLFLVFIYFIFIRWYCFCFWLDLMFFEMFTLIFKFF